MVVTGPVQQPGRPRNRVLLGGWPQGCRRSHGPSLLTGWVLVERPTGICRRLSGGSQAHETQSGVPGLAMGSTRSLTAPRAPACHVHHALLNT